MPGLFSTIGAIGSYIYKWFFPPPAPGSAFGFRWQAGQGVPALSIYDVNNNPPPAGLYVVFQSATLAPTIDPFGRGEGGPGPVFAAPGVVSAALTNLINTVSRNPPAGEGVFWSAPTLTAQRTADIDGFLSYTANCLDLIHQTQAGATLLDYLNATGQNASQYPTFISPGAGTNQTAAANMGDAMNAVANAVIDFLQNQAMPGAIDGIVQQRYAAIVGAPARYNQLAADMNNMPLYSLFVANGAFTANFLATFFQYAGQGLTGQDLMTWLTQGFPAFEAHLRTWNASQQSVLVTQFFLLALIIALYPNATPGTGAGAGVRFNVRNEGDNVLAAASFRPPAIGLAHELMHAMHYAQGTAPGAEFGHFTTTAAELLFVGTGPFAGVQVSENAIRGQWNGVLNPDATNVWAAPTQRTIYDAPVPPNTVATLRTGSHCI
jgi:hypothetical protein